MAIKRDGPVTIGTRRNLIQGLRAKPMAEPAVDAILQQAGDLSEKLVETYSTQIAAGEVGADGSGRASEAPILGQRAPTALMYGRVQSGKTAAMILTAALCLDNGFKIVVVLTADNVALVEQTAIRFKSLDGPRVFSSIKDDAYEWDGAEDEIREDLAQDGLLLVCAKDAFHLPHIIRFLQQIEAPLYPTLVFDDEADAATPDTTVAARAAGRPNAPGYPSTINRRVIENPRPGEEGQSIGEIFPHSLFVQVTATPYLLFLQRHEARIRPNVIFLLEPGDGYRGGEAFFGAFDPGADREPPPPIVLVPQNEGQALNRRRIPTGLASSIDFFVLAATAKASVDGWPPEGFKHLSHPSHRINQHTVVAAHIDQHLTGIRRRLRDTPDEERARLTAAYAELRKTMPAPPTLDRLVQALPEAIRQAESIRVNSETDVPRYGPRFNFLIGGNILGRGLTIDDLLVTYYVREAQVSQMDTVWQHARMYGYRESLMSYTRVFLPRRVASRFKEIHLAEEELRGLLSQQAAGAEVLVRVARGTRPTRPNAIEPAALRVVGAGLQQLFPWFIQEDSVTAARILEMLRGANVPVEEGDRADRATPIPVELMFDLIEAVPLREDDPGRWHPGAISTFVETFEAQYGGHASIYVRRLQAEAVPSTGWNRGRLGGPEIALIQAASPNAPALALLYAGDAERPRGWYPTLVLPPGTPTYILNPE